MRALAGVVVLVAACGGGSGGPDGGGPGGPDAAPGTYPRIDDVSPATIPAGDPDTTVTLTGTNFAADAVIEVDGVARAATAASATSMAFVLTADELFVPAVYRVDVVNPGPTGGVSSAVAVTVIEPNRAPTVLSIAPNHVDVGAAGFDLVVTGTDFLPGAVVRWNGADRATTFASETQLTAAIDAADVATEGTAMVDVVNPGPGGGPSPTSATFFTLGVITSGVLERVSLSDAGGELGSASSTGAISATARYVAFVTRDASVVAGDTNGREDAFVRDTCRGAPAGCTPTTIRASLNSDGTEPTGPGVSGVELSADGRYVAFRSGAAPMVPGSQSDSVYIRDTCLGAPAGCTPQTLAGTVVAVEAFDMSTDARYLAFLTSQRLVPEDTLDSAYDVYLRDTCLGAPAGCAPSYILVTADATGQAVGHSFTVSVSADARYVAFESSATNLIAGDANANTDAFARDTCVGAPAGCTPQTVRVNVDSAGAETAGPGRVPSIDPTGRYVAFSTPNVLVAGAVANDVYLYDTCFGATGCTPSQTLVSVMQAGGGAGNCRATGPRAAAAGGRYVLFASSTNGIDPRDDNGVQDIYVRDTCAGATGCTPTTAYVSIMPGGVAADAASGANDGMFLSADGRLVGFDSSATNLITGDTNTRTDVFVAGTGF